MIEIKKIILFVGLFPVGQEASNVNILNQKETGKTSHNLSQIHEEDSLYSMDFLSPILNPILVAAVSFVFLISWVFLLQNFIDKEKFYRILFILILCCGILLNLRSTQYSDPQSNKKRIIQFYKKQINASKNNLTEISEENLINFEIIFKEYDTDSLIFLLRDSKNLIVFDKSFDTATVLNEESFDSDLHINLKHREDILKTIEVLLTEKIGGTDHKQKFHLLIQQIKKDFPNKTIITCEEFLEFYTQIAIISNINGVFVFRLLKGPDGTKIPFKTRFLIFLEKFFQIFNENIGFEKDTYYKYTIDENLMLKYERFKITENDFFSESSFITEKILTKLIKGIENKDLVAVSEHLLYKFYKTDLCRELTFLHCFIREKQQINLIKNLTKIGLWGSSGLIDIFFLMEQCLLKEAQIDIGEGEIIIREPDPKL